VVCFTKTRQSQVCAYPPAVGRSSRVAIRPPKLLARRKIALSGDDASPLRLQVYVRRVARAVPDLGRLADADVKNVVE
jgi:hypothetical protein